jgi:hypothetical protein
MLSQFGASPRRVFPADHFGAGPAAAARHATRQHSQQMLREPQSMERPAKPASMLSF